MTAAWNFAGLAAPLHSEPRSGRKNALRDFSFAPLKPVSRATRPALASAGESTSFSWPTYEHKKWKYGPSVMTKLLDQALEAARGLPPDAQDDIAHVVLRLAGADDEPAVPLTPEEQAAIASSKAAAARGEFATDEQVRAVWAKHGL